MRHQKRQHSKQEMYPRDVHRLAAIFLSLGTVFDTEDLVTRSLIVLKSVQSHLLSELQFLKEVECFHPHVSRPQEK